MPPKRSLSSLSRQKLNATFKALKWPHRDTELAAVLTLLALSSAANAHGGEDLTDANAWTSWSFTPDIVLATLLVLAVYVTGWFRRHRWSNSRQIWQAVFFVAGLAAIFLSLQSPLDPIAERLFFMHQIQHFLLRMIGPMLIAFAMPQATLIAGLPRGLRRSLLKRPLENDRFRALLAPVIHSVTATALFIGTLYFWEIPRYHDLAIINAPVHYAMHLSMLLSGLLFWWRIFDSRPEPKGSRYGVRLMMLWLAMLSGIALGSYTTIKQTVLYEAYDVHGRLWGFSGVADEQLGGLIIWVPSAMMCLLAVILTIHAMGLHEERLERARTAWTGSNWAAMAYPSTGEALVAQAKPKNRMMALSFGIFAALVFSTAILFGVLDLRFNRMRIFDAPTNEITAPAEGMRASAEAEE